MAGRKGPGVTLTAAERYSRAVEREAEVTAQLAAADERIAHAQESLQTLGTYGGRPLATLIAAAEHAEDGAMAALLDATSQVAIDEGSELEEAAREALAAAQERHTETRAVLADLRAWQVKTTAEAETVQAQLAEDKQRRGELAKLAAAFARQVAVVKKLAGVEKVQAAQTEREAITARILAAEQELAAAQQQLEAHYGVVGAIKAQHADLADTREVRTLSEPEKRRAVGILDAWITFLDTVEANAGLGLNEFFIEGVYVPQLIAPSGWNEPAVRALLEDTGRSVVGRFEGARRQAIAVRDKVQAKREREIAALPPVVVA